MSDIKIAQAAVDGGEACAERSEVTPLGAVKSLLTPDTNQEACSMYISTTGEIYEPLQTRTARIWQCRPSACSFINR
jgi:hypothetical protein